VLYGLVVVLLAWSGIRPYDRVTWMLEVAPVVIAFPLLWWTRRTFPLTTLLYVLIAIHAAILIVGGAYSYARVPIGFTVQEWFGLSRNPYDKLGHFAQGFIPAMIAREIFVRRRVINGRGWLVFVIVCVVLAVSASYELIEWAAAVALGQGADEFLGTQGDVWDTQSDMFMALLGAIGALLSLSSLHDRQLAEVDRERG
jgi:putative membrane protein